MKTLKFVSLGVVAFAICGLMAFAQQGQTPEKMADHMERNATMQECARACSDCQRACDICAAHSTDMRQDGKKEHVTTSATCRDCATICSAAAQIVARGGPLSGLICESCASACGRCAAACETLPGDEHMKSCAEQCRKCEKACKKVMDHMASK
jgi:hypothetical protein